MEGEELIARFGVGEQWCGGIHKVVKAFENDVAPG